MQKILFIVILSLFSLTCIADDKTHRDFRIIGRDYSIFEDNTNVFSFGLASWMDKEHGTDPAIYCSFVLFSYKNIVRFETGACGTLHSGDKWVDPSLLTGISTPIFDRLVLGIWMSPFWNLYGKHSDDPYGIMIGYSLNL